MAAMPGLTVYNIPPSPPKWDRVGVFYIAWCVAWSTVLLAGMAFCLVNRHNPILRVRGLSLSFPAIALLHVYWILGQITYPIGGTVRMVLAYDIQYFAMGVYFPLGIALFHASNHRFLHIAKLQKQFVHAEPRAGRDLKSTDASWLCRLRNIKYTTKIFLFIGIGMVLQVCCLRSPRCGLASLKTDQHAVSLFSPSECGSLVKNITQPTVFPERGLMACHSRCR